MTNETTKMSQSNLTDLFKNSSDSLKELELINRKWVTMSLHEKDQDWYKKLKESYE
jgi:hypothetical protein